MNKPELTFALVSDVEASKEAGAAPDCYTAAWRAWNLQIGGGMGTLLGWARQAMEEGGVVEISTSTGVTRGVGPQRQRVVAIAQNINCVPPGGGIGIPCFAVLSVSDTTVAEANNLNQSISDRWKELMGL